MERVYNKLKDLENTWRQDKSKALTPEQLQQIGLKGLILRPYQLEGVNWLIQRWRYNHGSILGDEMGLGKTCQTISFITYLMGAGHMKGAVLVVSPLSVIANWQDEFKRFSPDVEILSYIGGKEERADLRRDFKKKNKFHVLLSTYEICMKDVEYLEDIDWSLLVVDEAHRLKNPNSLLYQTLRELKIGHRFLLTGTPVQNNLSELYSLLSFVAPKVFRLSACQDFTEEFQDISDDKKLQNNLHNLLKPFLLRRTKNEVVLDLPKKSEVLLFHGLSAIQKKLYKAILTKDLGIFQQLQGTGPNRTSLANILMQLRKCVSHPYMFNGVEPEPFELGDHLIDASGKLHLLDQLLRFLWQHNHKVLLFSQMTYMLDILQDYLGYRGYSYERLDGSVRGEERFLAVRNFNEQDETFVFLLSTKAGGQGLNLVGADTVIFVDSDFNPQNDIQAAARAHRIGQTKPVKVIRLVGRDTVEEVILRRADMKLRLTNKVIEGGQFSSIANASSTAVSATQVRSLLQFGDSKLAPWWSNLGSCPI
ncbi:Chromodomain-helicase-DNA-binding protein 1-like [Holothuria leucospilota]|uniref:Chromodomain-helicase-DNA-binding protein 1-like n=1 Tax=Holothuria leucospilota TaxID=206669 RepID=A0A9Q1BW54_HOLLE|nr:Chromodomain-helicase-DNA-binding protein 1-like [Holothuria leucospilota]